MELIDHRGLGQEVNLEVALAAEIIEPEEEEEEEEEEPAPPPFIGVVIPPPEPEPEPEEPEPEPVPDFVYEPLKVSVDEISTLGLVTIAFNQAIKPVDLAKIDDSVLDLEVEPGPYEKSSSFDPSQLSFEWEAVDSDYAFNQIFLQVNFTNALLISPDPQQD